MPIGTGLAPCVLRTARFDDYEGIAPLEAVLGSPLPFREWRNHWQANPLWDAVGARWPIGWVLEARGGKIAGYLGNIPVRYHFKGERLLGACGRGWIVEPRHRGRGPLHMLQTRFAQPNVDLFVETTIGSAALRWADKYCDRVPAGDWSATAYRITGYRSFATRALRKLGVPLADAIGPLAGTVLRLKDSALDMRAPKTAATCNVEFLERFDSRFDRFWSELLRQNPDTLLAARDAATLSWHFSVPAQKRELWILTASRNQQLRAYCILKKHDVTGDVGRLRLIDYQTIDRDVDYLPEILTATERLCSAKGISVLDRPGTGLAKWRAFDRWAPYRATQSWPFFYHATDPKLAAELRRPTAWDPSEYDGDASLA